MDCLGRPVSSLGSSERKESERVLVEVIERVRGRDMTVASGVGGMQPQAKEWGLPPEAGEVKEWIFPSSL